MPLPPVTIVIPVYNDGVTLAACVRSVLRHTQYPDWQLLVIDDDSTDGGPQTLKGIEGVRIVRKKARGGTASALNAGFALCPGRDVVRLHADVVVETSDWLTLLVEAAQARPNAAVVGVRLLYPDGLIQTEGRNIVSGFGFNLPHPDRKSYQPDGPSDGICEVDSVAGSLAYYRREALDRVGGLDEHYGPAWLEDDDYCMAVRRLGYKVYVHPGVKAVHYVRSRPPFMRAVINSSNTLISRITHGAKEQINRVQAEYWEAKWGWHPYHPDVSEIRRLYGQTEICWQIGEPLRNRNGEEFPTVDCCLVTWNSLARLRLTLESLARTDWPAEKIRVYVADNGSTDGSVAYLKSLAPGYPFAFHLIELPLNTGVAAGINFALLAGKGEFVARLDDDIVLPAHWLKALHADLQRRPFAGCAGPKTVNDDERAAIQWACQYVHPGHYTGGDETDRGQADQLARVFHVAGCCNLFRRDVFARCGLVDVRYSPTQYDDIDHHFALFQAGYEVLYDGRVTITHKRTTGLDQSAAGLVSANANRAKLLGKWGKDCMEIVENAILYSREGRTLPPDGDTSALLAGAPPSAAFPRKGALSRAAIRFVIRGYEELNGRTDQDSPVARLCGEYLSLAAAEAKFSGATEITAAALAVAPTRIEAFRALADLLHRSGQTERATRIARRGLHLFPDDPLLNDLATATWAQIAARVDVAAEDGLRLPSVAPATPPAPEGGALRVLMVYPFQPRLATEDVTRLKQLAEHLRQHGVQVDLCGTAHPNPRGYDIVHFWNTAFPYQTLAQMKAARTQAPDVPRVLTPLYADDRTLTWNTQVVASVFSSDDPAQIEQGLLQLAEGKATYNGVPRPTVAREVYGLNGRDACSQKVFQLADYLMPCSRLEAQTIAAGLGIQVPGSLLPSCADPAAFAGVTAMPFVERHHLEHFILAAGPIRPAGNQLMLLFAARSLGLPVVVVGPVSNGVYGNLCRQYAPADTLFLPSLTPEMYASALVAARVFVDLSWMPADAPHAVEAAMADCSLVLGDRLLEKEPFEPDATFCDPADVNAVRAALTKAHAHYDTDAPKRARLRQRLAARNSWTQAVESVLQGYSAVLARRAT